MSEGYWHRSGGSKLIPLTSGMYVSTWSETGRQRSRWRANILDSQMKLADDIIALSLPRQSLTFDVAALHGGGFAVVWNQKNLMTLQIYDVDGSCRKSTIVGVTSQHCGPVQLVIFPTGEIAIGCADFVSILCETGLLLCAVSQYARRYAMTSQKSGNMIHVEMIDKHPSYPGPPIYGLYGSIMNQAGMTLRKFHLNVPTTIVGNTYSHPDHLAISAMDDGGFVIIWTQLGHTLGNSILGRVFDEEGKALGETFIVAVATFKSSVNEPAVVSCVGGRFLVAWSENDDPIHVHRFQIFDKAGIKHGATSALNRPILEGRGAVKLDKIPTGQILAYWTENEKTEFIYISADQI